jgi:phosphoglycolate phosphatase
MANDAGVWSAWAEYGTHFDPDDWARLVRVTHWAPEDIERAEFAKREHRQAQPDVVLQAGLRDILEYFEFVRPTQLGEK